MSSRRRNQQKYTRLPQDDGDGDSDHVDTGLDDPTIEAQTEGFTASQFARPPVKIPYKAILLSCFLFLVGSVCWDEFFISFKSFSLIPIIKIFCRSLLYSGYLSPRDSCTRSI